MATQKFGNKTGNPTLYDPDVVLPYVEKQAKAGCTNAEIAKGLGINYSTFKVWQNKHPALKAVLKRAKGLSLIEVENALYKCAVGYEFEEVTQQREKVNGKYKMVITQKTVKHVKPSQTAQIFILKNKKPEEYRDRVEQLHSIASDMESVEIKIKRRGEE